MNSEYCRVCGRVLQEWEVNGICEACGLPRGPDDDGQPTYRRSHMSELDTKPREFPGAQRRQLRADVIELFPGDLDVVQDFHPDLKKQVIVVEIVEGEVYPYFFLADRQIPEWDHCVELADAKITLLDVLADRFADHVVRRRSNARHPEQPGQGPPC